MALMPVSMSHVLRLAGLTFVCHFAGVAPLLSSRAHRSVPHSDLQKTEADEMDKVAGILSQNVQELDNLMHIRQQPSSSYDREERIDGPYGASPSLLRYAAQHGVFPTSGLQLGRFEAVPIDRGPPDTNAPNEAVPIDRGPPDTVAPKGQLPAKPSNSTKTTATGATATKQKDSWVTFDGRFSTTVGPVIWGLIGTVIALGACCLIWCCCAGLLLFTLPNNHPTDNEEDKELHEVWVRSSARK